MDKQKPETQISQKIFHYNEYNIEKVCASLENGKYLLLN